jgi:uncharacterized membrane protein YkvA (DUF1232 family)
MSADVSRGKVVSFYRSLQARVELWLGTAEAAGVAGAELYHYLPALYMFLVRAAMDVRLPQHERNGIIAALKYIVAPYDLIPEGVVGTSGFRDDLVLAAMVVDRLYRVLEPELLDEHWFAPGSPLQVVGAIMDARAQLVPQEVSDRLTAWLPQ